MTKWAYRQTTTSQKQNWESCFPLVSSTGKNNRTSAHLFQCDSLHINSFSVISQTYLSEIIAIIHNVRMLKGFTERVKAKEEYSPSLKYPELWHLLKSTPTQEFGLTLTITTKAVFILILNSLQSLQNSGRRFTLGISPLFQTFPVPSPTRHHSSTTYSKPFPLKTSSKGSSGKVRVSHCICSSSYCFLNYLSTQTTNRRMSYNTPSSTLS